MSGVLGSGIGQRPRKPVELGDHQRVAFAARGQGFAQAWPFPVGPGQSLIDVDPTSDHAECREVISLGRQVLLIGGHPGIIR